MDRYWIGPRPIFLWNKKSKFNKIDMANLRVMPHWPKSALQGGVPSSEAPHGP